MNLLLNCKTYPINVDVRLYGVFSARSRIFHSFEDVTITSEGLHILTYARHSWPLGSVDSLACYNYFDTWHLLIMLTPEDPWHSHVHLLLSVWQWGCHFLFLRLRSVEAGILIPKPSAWETNALPQCATVAASEFDIFMQTIIRMNRKIEDDQKIKGKYTVYLRNKLLK